MKKQNLISLLAIPLITILTSCINNDQIRNPNNKPPKYNISKKEIKIYNNLFLNAYHYSNILEIRKNKKLIKTYVGNGNLENPKIEFIEKDKKLFNRKSFQEYPKEEQIKLQKEYEFYLNEINKLNKRD